MPTNLSKVTPLLETLETIALFQIDGNEKLSLEFGTSNHSALDQFVVSGRTTESAPFRVLYDQASDFTAPQGHVFGASGDLTSLAANSDGYLELDNLKSLFEVKIEAAQAAGAQTTVTAFGRLG